MKKKQCSCPDCKKCCWHNPGWFGSVSEIRGAAKLKGLTVKEFCKEYLIVEYMEGEKRILVPAPRRNFSRINSGPEFHYNEFIAGQNANRNGKGFVTATWAHNLISGVACIFLDEKELCSIHKSKPQECAKAFGCGKDHSNKREDLLKYWKTRKNWVLKQQE